MKPKSTLKYSFNERKGIDRTADNRNVRRG